MQADPAGDAARRRLEPLLGQWSMEVFFQPDSPAPAAATTVFDWILDGQFLQQRSEVDHPDAPDGFSIIAVNSDGDTYTQHYYDSRGVVRLYSMTFDGREWTLLRDAPDFSPLSFSQRFTGTLDDEAQTISGRWETSRDGLAWEKDFDLTYTRIG